MAKWWSALFIAFLIPLKLSKLFNFFMRKGEVPKVDSIDQAEDYLEELSYSKDEFRLGAFRIKHFFMKQGPIVANQLQTKKSPQFDCDEFATYALALFSQFKISVGCTVRWIDKEGKVKGHNTCVFMDGSKWGTACNWKVKTGYSSRAEAIHSFAKITGGTTIAYCLWDEDFNIVDYVKCG